VWLHWRLVYSCRIANNSSCTAQGVQFGTKPDGQKCSTDAYLCPNTDLASATATETPCCRTCTDFAGTNNWFWQCSLPRTDSSTTATYTFDMIAGQFYYMGKCDVIVSEETVAVQNCIVAPGWTATTVHFYLGKTNSTTCAPGQFGSGPTGYTESFPATTGLLPVGWFVPRTYTGGVPDPIYVMMHFNSQR
jgi:hypothetical protein